MRKIEYLINIPTNKGTEENPVLEDCLFPKSLPYSPEAEEIAKAEAHNGEYTIEDDGQVETYWPSIQEQLDAQAAALMELMGVVYNG